MKNRTMALWSILLLVLIAMAVQPQKAEARDNIYLGVDLGGLVMGFNTYPYREYVPVSYPPERVWYPAHYRHYPPPRPVYYEAYERRHHSPPHYRSHYRRDGRRW